MSEPLYTVSYRVGGGDFDKAGEVSTRIKATLKELALNSTLIRHVAIATFEAEMNVVIHAHCGEIVLALTELDIVVSVTDEGPGIPDIGLAMTEGYSTAPDEAREMGFGAGMGLPNIRKNCDEFEIESTVGQGTSLRLVFHHGG